MAEIVSYVTPSRLYRYRSLKNLEREIEAIREGYLFCAPYGHLNDPMEGLFSSSARLRQSAKYRTVKNEIVDEKGQIGICSFSEVHDHELMWAHYADQFRGICVAYRFSQLRENLGGENSFVRMFYNEEVPTVHLTNEPTIELAKMVLSYKNYRWLYEREWRMFAQRGKASYGDASCVSRVYLGFRITTEHRRKVKRELKRLGIEVRDMSIKKYSMSFAVDDRFLAANRILSDKS